MSWKKHFRLPPASQIPMPQGEGGGNASAKYSSYLPEVYAGAPNRIQRYYQYDEMDRDSDINAALDTIADFCTQSEEQNDNPLLVNYLSEANETEVKLIKQMLTKWIKINDFKSRLWYIFRNTIKNGDAVFLRDPETMEWLWVDHYNVLMVKVKENAGNVPAEYAIRGLEYFKQSRFATKPYDPASFSNGFGQQQALSRPAMPNVQSAFSASINGAMTNSDPRMQKNAQPQAQTVHVVDADKIIHLSLSVGMDINWPFGQSVLEAIFKTYKQKELLEDSLIIYRVQRAPERRIFYIDTGTMPQPRAKAHIQAIKNEIHQRRIPNRTGGGTSILDAAYNPLSILEDYFFAQGSDGRGSKVETLPGGENLGETGDLDYFTQKLARGLRIPPTYLSFTEQTAFNDGKIGQALIQEFRFNKYCMRLQSLLAPVFDREFKKFLKENGISIDNDMFELKFHPPQNFAKYRQIELDLQQTQVYSQVAQNTKLSERFKLKRFLNLTEEEVLENERLWAEENPGKIKRKTGSTPADQPDDSGLSAIGMRSGEDDAFGSDDMGPEPTPDQPEPEAPDLDLSAPPPDK